MTTLNLTASTKPQELILSYLQENVSDILAEKINNGTPFEKDGKQLINKKTLDGFMKFANDEARKLAENDANCACIEDSVVYGWAIHYFEEDSIEGELYNEDGTKYTPPKTAIKHTPKPVATAIKSIPAKHVERSQNKPQQTSLWDMLDNNNEQVEIQEENEELSQDEIDDILYEISEQDAAIKPNKKLSAEELYKKFRTLQNEYPNDVVFFVYDGYYKTCNEMAFALSKDFDLYIFAGDYGTEYKQATIEIPLSSKDVLFGKILKQHSIIIIDNTTITKYLLDKETGEITEVQL